jgi:hypothetical protein
MPPGPPGERHAQRREVPVDENVTKEQGVQPAVEKEDVHGYDTRTASPQGTDPSPRGIDRPAGSDLPERDRAPGMPGEMPARKTGPKGPEPHNEPTKPAEVDRPGPKPHSEPTQPMEVEGGHDKPVLGAKDKPEHEPTEPNEVE